MSPGWQNTQITDGSQLSGTKVRIHYDETLSAAEGFFPPVSFLTPPSFRGQCPPIRSHLLSSRPLVFSRRTALRSQPVRLIIIFFIYFFPFALHITSPLAIWTTSLANWHKPLGSARSLCCKKHLVSVSQPAGAQHLVVMDLDMWLGTMLRTEGSGEEEGGGSGKERGSEGKKTFIATEHETHLSDAWHSDRWWKSHFMLQTWCTFEILVLIDLLGCLSHPTCHDDNVMCEPRPWGFDE